MSSKLGTKSVKRASSNAKKKGSGGTPDFSTPTASGASIGIDKPSQESTIDDVLTGDEVDVLRIKEGDLMKVHPPKPPNVGKPFPHKRKIFVKKNQPHGLPQQKEKRVAVLHPLPPGITVTATSTIGSMERGPRFDQQGKFLSHSVLGPTGDFATELKNRHLVGSVSALVKVPPIVLPDVKKERQSKAMSYENTIIPREKNALKFWDESMKQRKAQQQYISNKVDSPPENLSMNHGDTFRSMQEERTLVDRAMPSVSYGKGYRVGSEFWSQPVQIGSQYTGIHTTLTRTEQGLPPELEFVGVPAIVAKEKGVASDLERNAPSHYTWNQSMYLSTLEEQLDGPLMDVHRPEVSELQVIGRAPGDCTKQRIGSLDSLGESASSDSDDVPVSVLDLQADISQPIIGPALLVNGKLLQWEGSPSPAAPERRLTKVPPRATQSEGALSTVRPVQESTISLREVDMKRVSLLSAPINIRVCLESDTGVRVTSHVELENCGTAAVYYSWQFLPKSNPLGTIQAGDTQRFYFDTKGGVLLPGQRLELPFIFKSPNAGIFSETWLFQTGPVLCRGKQVIFTLKGIAFQDDLNKHKRDELENELKHHMAEVAAQRLINRIVDNIRTPSHILEPITTIKTEEHIFQEQNPEFYYHHGVVQKLKTLYDSIPRPELLLSEQLTGEPVGKPEKMATSKKDDKMSGNKGKERAGVKDKKGGKLKDEPIKEEAPSREEEAIPQVPVWDFSVTSLREVILSVNEVAVMESKLKELNALVGLLTFPPPKRIRTGNYNIVYEALCEAVDLMYDVSTSLSQTMGLPIREFSQKEECDKQGDTDGLAFSQPATPAHTKEKRGGKDTKKARPRKDSLKSGSSKSKPISQKKSKPSLGSRDMDTIKQMMSETSTSIDPAVRIKYAESFHSLIYEILGATADKIELLIPHE